MVWSVTVPGKPSNMNADRNRHWAKRAAMTKEWRQAAAIYAKTSGLPKRLDTIGITVQHNVKGRLSDVCSCVETVKAVVDGFVDYGLIEDDTPDHLLWIRFIAPVKTGTDELVFTVEEAIREA